MLRSKVKTLAAFKVRKELAMERLEPPARRQQLQQLSCMRPPNLWKVEQKRKEETSEVGKNKRMPHPESQMKKRETFTPGNVSGMKWDWIFKVSKDSMVVLATWDQNSFTRASRRKIACSRFMRKWSKISSYHTILNIHWNDWCWSWNSNTLATWWEELIHWKRPWYWERLKAGGEGDDGGWDGWMATPNQWTWV